MVITKWVLLELVIMGYLAEFGDVIYTNTQIRVLNLVGLESLIISLALIYALRSLACHSKDPPNKTHFWLFVT